MKTLIRDLTRPGTTRTRTLVALLALQLAFPLPLNAATLTLSNVPLTQPTSESATVPIKPNLLFILDDSGSMGQDYTPDYVNDSLSTSSNPKTIAGCFDGGTATSSSILDTPNACALGDPPYMSADFNRQYYDPSIRYQAGVDYQGNSLGDQSTLTNVRTDPYNRQNRNQLGNSTNFVNLQTTYPDRVWCTATGDSATGPNCVTNSAYTYPDPVYPYGVDGSNNRKYKNGAPYWYTIVPTEHCTGSDLKTCVASNSPTTVSGVSYNTPAKVRFCKVTGSFSFSSIDFNDCQAKQIGDYIYPKYLGTVSGSTTVPAATIKVTANPQAFMDILTIQVGGTADILNGTLTGYTTSAAAATAIAASINARNAAAGQTEFIACASNSSAGQGCNQAPYNTYIVGASSSTVAPSDTVFIFPTVASGSTVAVTSTTLPAPVVTGTVTTTGFAAASFDVLSTASTGTPKTAKINDITINGSTMLSGGAPKLTFTDGTDVNAVAAQIVSSINGGPQAGNWTASSSGATVTVTSNTAGTGNNAKTLSISTPSAGKPTGRSIVVSSSGLTSVSKTITVFVSSNSSCLAPTVTLGSTTTSSNSRNTIGGSLRAIALPAGWTSSGSNQTATFTPPGGSQYNNWYLCASKTGAPVSWSISPDQFGNNGFDAQDLSTTSAVTAGGFQSAAIPTSAAGFSQIVRGGVGTFQRTDLVACPGGASDTCFGKDLSGNKFADRVDCASAAGCTYAEESTNFGNWYAYYRTRMQMMKTAGGRAFTDVTSAYRVGFMTIHPSSSAYVRISDFDTTQRNSWYTMFYSISPGSATPLRSALSTAGRIFAGKNPLGLGTSDDPMQYACQQNFTLLTTDGYWNENWDTSIKKVDGTQMTDDDGSSSVGRPFFDGAVAPTCGPGANQSGNPTRSCGTLADVAQHYYVTDLRTPATYVDATGTTVTGLNNCTGAAVSGVTNDVCENRVKGNGEDNISSQHMTTFTLGLGVDGQLAFRDDYKTAPTGDYAEILAGTRNWPAPNNNTPSGVDDLWHAAVNGRGTYLSARNPASLASGLQQALAGIKARQAAGAAAAASNLEPVAGDNFAYVASYITNKWTGNLEARAIDVVTGSVGEQALWCAEDVAALVDKGTTACTGTLKGKVAASTDSRNIYLFDGGAASKLRSFVWGNLTVAERAFFDISAVPQLTQYTGMSVSERAAATGDTVVNYLRGQTGYEDRTENIYKIYRTRESTLGDIVGSQPNFVGVSKLKYDDPGYTEYKAAVNSRTPTVFVASNDGMLHSFNATVGDATNSGQEQWAYIPGMLLPNLKLLADENYTTQRKFYVDGSPVVGDICVANCGTAVSAQWKTILVGGLNAGGKGFYALDVSDPTNPKGLWEISSATEANLGYSFGNPVITKRPDGTWVVLLTSGYNNVGDGIGRLYVVDAATGAVLSRISTGAGSAGTPSGLSRISGFVSEVARDNTTRYVYGGDLLGNVWRFDLSDNSVVKVGLLKDASGNPQPVTSAPTVTLDNDSAHRLVLVGTGQLLEVDDLVDTQTQSIYAFRDIYDDETRAVGVCAACTNGARNDDMVNQTITPKLNGSGVQLCLTDIGTEVTVADASCASKERISSANARGSALGWYVDLPVSGERVNLDMQLVSGVLVAATNIPSNDACTSGGDAWITQMDPFSGLISKSVEIKGAFVVGFLVIGVGGGRVILATKSSDTTPKNVGSVPPATGSAAFQGKRVTWRELDNN